MTKTGQEEVCKDYIDPQQPVCEELQHHKQQQNQAAATQSLQENDNTLHMMLEMGQAETQANRTPSYAKPLSSPWEDDAEQWAASQPVQIELQTKEAQKLPSIGTSLIVAFDVDTCTAVAHAAACAAVAAAALATVAFVAAV